MYGSGLKELFVFGTALKDGTAEKVLSGKGYYQTINTHMLVYEALEALRFDAFEHWVIEEGISMDVMAEMSELMSSLGRELKEGTPIMQTVHKLQKFLPHFQIFIDQFESCKKDSKTYQLWSNYLHMIKILLSYIHAEGSGEWQEHLSATAEMAEYIAAADHTKYIKAVMCYLNEMGNIQTEAPEIYEAFERGYFTVKRSSGEFNAIWTDMALECS